MNLNTISFALVVGKAKNCSIKERERERESVRQTLIDMRERL